MIQASTTFYAIDFDRCLSDTQKLDDIFYEVVAEFDELNKEELIASRKAIEDQGGSFDQVAPLQQQLTSERVVAFFKAFIDKAQQHDILSDGARELMEKLSALGAPFGIVSYGEIEWQSIKIEASGVTAVPALIIDHKRKGEVIATWQQPDGSFLIPDVLTRDGDELQVETVVLMDDKADAFIGLPETARGYWVQSITQPLLPSQQGTVPSNVRVAHGLSEVVTLEVL